MNDAGEGRTGVERAPTPARGVCGVLVTFRPDPRTFGEVFRAAITQLDHLIVIDNGSGSAVADEVRSLLTGLPDGARARLTPRFYSENLGLPLRFNEAIALARDAGDRFVLFLDHDSVLAPDAVRRLLEVHDRLAGTVPLGALEAHNEEPVELPTDDFLVGYWGRHPAAPARGLSEDFLGTNSGLFVPLPVFDRVGGFDESFFLDAVDFEFTLRLHAAGYRVLKIHDAAIRHQRGELATAPGPGFSSRIRRVRPLRHYYVARDVLRTWLRYGRRFPLVGLFLLSMPLREAVLVLLFYPERRRHLHFLGLGTLHALQGVKGPLPEP